MCAPIVSCALVGLAGFEDTGGSTWVKAGGEHRFDTDLSVYGLGYAHDSRLIIEARVQTQHRTTDVSLKAIEDL